MMSAHNKCIMCMYDFWKTFLALLLNKLMLFKKECTSLTYFVYCVWHRQDLRVFTWTLICRSCVQILHIICCVKIHLSRNFTPKQILKRKSQEGISSKKKKYTWMHLTEMYTFQVHFSAYQSISSEPHLKCTHFMKFRFRLITKLGLSDEIWRKTND